MLVKKFKGKYFIAVAKDTLALQAFLFGADAYICELSNAFPEIIVGIHSAVMSKKTDLVTKLQHY
ncbi:MAG: hypothetical protein DRO15_06565 [Thermoprotei archaeon]|nr:MAG: hypothetical protein DRO15_06565 [Thermoprotei archaeon]